MIPLVPEPRRGQALSYKFTLGRFCSLKSYHMLGELLESEYGIGQFEWEYGEHGKPSLKGLQHIHFNISHCPRAIAVAVASEPIGIDVEKFHKADVALLERCMNPEERMQIAQSPNVQEAFTALWTRKEAVFKLTGTGITDNLHNILTPDVVTTTQVNNSKEYVLSIARFRRDVGNHPHRL